MTTNVSVRSSPIEGMGVFAERHLHRGETLLTIDDSRIVDDARPLLPNEEPRFCDYLERGKVIWMQPPERHINHSCDPNTYTKTLQGKRHVLALRDISAGEEITYDYCINGDGDTVWQCHCGASRCRHEIHSDFFHLPFVLQRDYLPLLDDWFRNEHRAEVDALTTRIGKQHL